MKNRITLTREEGLALLGKSQRGKRRIAAAGVGRALPVGANRILAASPSPEPLRELRRSEETASALVDIFIEIDPMPKERPRLTIDKKLLWKAMLLRDMNQAMTAFSIRTPSDTRLYEKTVASCVKYAMRERSGPVGSDEDIHLDLIFVRRRKPGRKADLDNLVKAIKDGMNAVLYHDDAQVTSLCTRVVTIAPPRSEGQTGMEPGVFITAYQIPKSAEVLPSLLHRLE